MPWPKTGATEYRLFGAKAFPLLSYYQFRTSDIAAVGTTFNVFSYDAVRAEHRTHHFPNAEQICYVLCQFDTYSLTLTILPTHTWIEQLEMR